MAYADIRVVAESGAALRLVALRGEEALSKPFEFTLRVNTKRPLVLADLLGTKMAVIVPLKMLTERYLHGHVVSVEEAGMVDRHYHYVIKLRPWIWLLNYNSNCRIFQDKTVVEIAQILFKKPGFTDFKVNLTQPQRLLDYAVQYRESDLAFLSRLLEQEGIYYYFVHEQDKHTLVLADSPGSHGDDESIGTIPFHPPSNRNYVGDAHLWSWNTGLRILPGGYQVDDYDFERPGASLISTAFDPGNHQHADAVVYDYPGEFTKNAEGERIVEVRLQSLRAAYSRAWGSCDVREMCAGRTFTLSNHPQADQNATYLVVSCHYEIHGESEHAEDKAPEFHTSINVIKRDSQYRPPQQTPRPYIAGHQTATVVGREGDEIYTDKHGRVKVHFPWDRGGEKNERSSCWIRVAQLWAGSGLGGIHVPRVGQEVLVSFLEGDPDRPIITGRVYNGMEMPPYELPAKATVSGIKSQSTPGGGGYNELSMDDAKDQERFVIHAQRDMSETVLRNHSMSIGGDDTHDVTGTRTTTITKKNTDTYKDEHKLDVKLKVEEIFQAEHTLTVTGPQTITVNNDVTETITGNYALTTNTSFKLTQGSTSMEFKAGAVDVNASGPLTITRGMGKVTMDETGKIILESTTGISLQCGAVALQITPAGVTVIGTVLEMN